MKLRTIESNSFNPYQNLGLEEYLLHHVDQDECILYLWQNQRTVVIGRNQNAWKECHLAKLEQDGGYLARRLSGGGAVFHDLGNLNFTFLVGKDNYDIDRQLAVIVKAIKLLGVNAKKTGRNDITIDGKKFSGNAFYQGKNANYHHGTLMVDVNKNDLSKYLNVSKQKLESHGVDSTKSRVTNIKAYLPNITINQVKQSVLQAFEDVYQNKAERINLDTMNQNQYQQLITKYQQNQWNYGKTKDFNHQLSKRFDWGDIDLFVKVKNGVINDIMINSDSLEIDWIERLQKQWMNQQYQYHTLVEYLNLGIKNRSLNDLMERDIKSLLLSEL